jgi:hypothetical protein
MSRAALIDVYIATLNLASIAVVSDGRRCRIHTGEPAEGKIKARFFFKPSHADLVLATIGLEGMSGKQPEALAASIERTAAMLGAPYQTPDELRKAAELEVAKIIAKVAASNQSGGLKLWNTAYKQHRRDAAAAGQKATSYAAFIERFVITPTVRNIAATGRMV